MNSGNNLPINEETYHRLLDRSRKLGLNETYDSATHQLTIADEEEWLFKFFLPRNSNFTASGALKLKDDFHLALVMIRAGIACTGYFHNGDMLDHKVFRAYMIRQKQGSSQIKYLKTKGKSRAGSRLRLGESERFFEEISERLNSYEDSFPITNWGISCAKTLLPYFFDSKPAPPFEKKQENLFSIPFHVQQPDFETLKDIHKKLNDIQLIVSEKESGLVEEVLTTFKAPENPDPEDDW